MDAKAFEKRLLAITKKLQEKRGGFDGDDAQNEESLREMDNARKIIKMVKRWIEDSQNSGSPQPLPKLMGMMMAAPAIAGSSEQRAGWQLWDDRRQGGFVGVMADRPRRTGPQMTFFRSVSVILEHKPGVSSSALLLNYRDADADTLAHWRKRRGNMVQDTISEEDCDDEEAAGGQRRASLSSKRGRKKGGGEKATTRDEKVPDNNVDLVYSVFGDAPIHNGGPVRDMRLNYLTSHKLATGRELGDGTGVYIGGDLAEAAKLVQNSKAHMADFSFYENTAEWRPGQLLGEVERGYWIVARPMGLSKNANAAKQQSLKTKKATCSNALSRLVFSALPETPVPTGDEDLGFSPSEEGQALWLAALRSLVNEDEGGRIAGTGGALGFAHLSPLIYYLAEVGALE